MKELEIIVPTDLSDITLEDYQLATNIINSDIDDIDKATSLIKLMCNMSLEDVRQLDVTQVEGLVLDINKALITLPKWERKFSLDGVPYGFEPQLDSIKFGAYVDIDTFIKDEADLNKVMGILYRPITYSSSNMYRIEKYEGDKYFELMHKMPMSEVKGTLVFFYHLGNDLLKVIPQYLEKEVAKQVKSKSILAKDGDGILAYTHLLKVTLEDLTKLPTMTSIQL